MKSAWQLSLAALAATALSVSIWAQGTDPFIDRANGGMLSDMLEGSDHGVLICVDL